MGGAIEGLIVTAGMEYMEQYQTQRNNIFYSVPCILFQPLQLARPPIALPTGGFRYRQHGQPPGAASCPGRHLARGGIGHPHNQIRNGDICTIGFLSLICTSCQ